MSEMLLREALANVTSGGWTDDERIEKVVGYQQTNMTASAFFSERVLVGGRAAIFQSRGDHPHPHPRFGMGDHRHGDSHRGFRALSTALSRSLSSASCQWPSGARAEAAALPGSPSRPLPALCPRGCGFQLTASSRYMCFSVK